MFDRFVRMAQCRAALRAGDHERGLRLSGDPVLDPGHRKVRALREEAIDGLLARARRALAGGAHAAARGALQAILAAEPGHPVASELMQAGRLQEEREGAERKEHAALLRAFDEALSRGNLDVAEGHAQRAPVPERDRLAERAAAQRARAAAGWKDACTRLEALGFDAAVRLLRRARALDGALEVDQGLREQLATQLARAALERPAAERAAFVAQALRAGVGLVEGLETVPCVARLAVPPERGEAQAILRAMEHGEYDAWVGQGAEGGAVDEVVAALAAAAEAARRGAFEEAARAVREAVPDSALRQRVSARLDGDRDRVDQRLGEARVAAQEGRLASARSTLLALLEEFPGHQGVRSELALLDRGADVRARELVEARALVRARRLSEAAARALPWALPGTDGDDARALLREVQPQLDVVRKGVEQVQASLHGPSTRSVEGLEVCLRRLDRLADVQVDSADLSRLREAIEVEIDGLQQFERAGEALASGESEAVAAALSGWAERRARLLAPGRLDARAESVVERVLVFAGDAAAAGRCARADAWLDAVGDSLPLSRDTLGKVRALRGDVTGRRVRAAHEAQVAMRLASEERDLTAASEALERAKALAADEPSVRRIAAELERAAGVALCMERIEALDPDAGADEVADARRALEDLGATPPGMRTRVFDLKRNLARAQGLEGAFLLRVDEAGEFLVFRHESASLGNVRDRGCDLPLQARLSSRHARLRRTMSFHGGQVDEVVAERGELRVAGERVPKVRLTDGLRFSLGGHVDILYRLPSARSLTARLDLQGGVQIGGATALLWLKDRGRDGRILIGPGPGSHIRVPGASGTVELFAGSDGRIRVRVDGDGTIDGAAFEGEHPVDGGAFVAALGVGFSVHPWSPSDVTAPPA